MKSIVVCTLGTSLFIPNLENLKRKSEEGELLDGDPFSPLASAYQNQNWVGVATALGAIDPSERTCGAEINSIASMIDKGYAASDCGLYFLHSATQHGAAIAEILRTYYSRARHSPVNAVEIEGLQDENPREFRTKGLRHLARAMGEVVRNHSAEACAINATGGYKAQIAIAVALGQAFGVSVFYKHERFNEIVSIPPLPISLDFDLWIRASDLLTTLRAAGDDPVDWDAWKDRWDDRFENLVDRVEIDGKQWIELSPVGMIFADSFGQDYRRILDAVMPPAAQHKNRPRLEDAGWPGEHPDVERHMQRLIDDVPFVSGCGTFYFNPDLPERTRFTLSEGNVVGIYSDGTVCAKFNVETTASGENQQRMVVAALNQWLSNPDRFRDLTDERIAELRQELEQQQTRRRQLEGEHSQLEQAWEKAESDLEASQSRVQELEEKQTRCEGELQELQSQFTSLQNEIEQLREENAALQNTLDQKQSQPWWRSLWTRVFGGSQ